MARPAMRIFCWNKRGVYQNWDNGISVAEANSRVAQIFNSRVAPLYGIVK
jgi:hypothetical protein